MKILDDDFEENCYSHFSRHLLLKPKIYIFNQAFEEFSWSIQLMQKKNANKKEFTHWIWKILLWECLVNCFEICTFGSLSGSSYPISNFLIFTGNQECPNYVTTDQFVLDLCLNKIFSVKIKIIYCKNTPKVLDNW